MAIICVITWNMQGLSFCGNDDVKPEYLRQLEAECLKKYRVKPIFLLQECGALGEGGLPFSNAYNIFKGDPIAARNWRCEVAVLVPAEYGVTHIEDDCNSSYVRAYPIVTVDIDSNSILMSTIHAVASASAGLDARDFLKNCAKVAAECADGGFVVGGDFNMEPDELALSAYRGDREVAQEPEYVIESEGIPTHIHGKTLDYICVKGVKVVHKQLCDNCFEEDAPEGIEECQLISDHYPVLYVIDI